ncbi:hypothetical protein EDD85DRAFT_957095 [Armillaria nabsnona]|nr:hypothetical protein EDD85DRAFT_957095 [Armillaria nabsnona]
MARISLWSEGNSVNEYGRLAAQALNPIVETISAATGLAGPIEGDFNLIVVQQTKTKNGRKPCMPIQNEDKAYSVKAEVLSRPFGIDATQKQIDAKAMIVKLALQMITANAEYEFFFGGLVAIAAQTLYRRVSLGKDFTSLVRLQTPKWGSSANIPTELFLAIIITMLSANLLPGRNVKNSPTPYLEVMPDADEGKEDDGDVNDDEEISWKSDIPIFALQVAANAHP